MSLRGTTAGVGWHDDQVPRKILVTGGEDSPIHLVETSADNEHELQTVLLNNSQLIPAQDLGLDGDLLVVGRETSLASGSVDLLCMSRSGELVIIEFKTGPQNPDFRAALAQVIDYGSDLWGMFAAKFDEGVVHRYLTGRHVEQAVKGTASLRQAADHMWGLDEESWDVLAARLEQVLSTGDFHFVVAAQRFTEAMKDAVRYLNEATRVGRYFLVEVVRLDGGGRTAYAAQVVEQPQSRSGSSRQCRAGDRGRLPVSHHRRGVPGGDERTVRHCHGTEAGAGVVHQGRLDPAPVA